MTSSCGGRRVSVLARWYEEVWPEPIWARAGAAQEVWLGVLRRLIPEQGQVVPGAMGARRKLSPIVWALVFRTSAWS